MHFIQNGKHYKRVAVILQADEPPHNHCANCAFTNSPTDCLDAPHCSLEEAHDGSFTAGYFVQTDQEPDEQCGVGNG